MLFNVVPVLLIFAALTIIIVIVLRRLPEITVINTDTIPEVRTATVKRQLLAQSLERKLRRVMAAVWAMAAAGGAMIQEIGVSFYKKLVTLEEHYRTMSSVRSEMEHRTAPLPADRVGQLLIDAQYKREAGHLEEAERLYLEAVRLEHRNAAAYFGLGLVYRSRHQYEEALQALRFSRRLQDNVLVAATLGEVCIEAGKTVAALTPLGDAVKYEPTNPHHLDRLLEAAILVGNKRVAKNALVKLEAIAPAYPRLSEFRERLAAIPSRRKQSSVAQ